MKSRKIVLYALILFIAVFAVLLGVFLYLPTYINNKITSEINDKTEFGIEIGKVSFTGISSLELRDINIQHKLGREDYIKSKGYQTDWIFCRIASFSISNIDWVKLFSDRNFFAEHISITSPDIYIFRDKRIPSKYKYAALPSMLLREMKFPFSIPEILIEDGKVIYEEVEKNGEKVQVPLHQLSVKIHNTSSDSLYYTGQPVMSIDANAIILDSIKATMTYSSNISNRNNLFSVEGNLQSFSAKLLNKCITPATHVKIENGIVYGVNFKFTGNDDVANGVMNMDYKNLKLTVLTKEKTVGGKKKLKKSNPISFLANLFVRNKDKKDTTSSPQTIPTGHTGEIHFERRKDRSIFNYWWHAFKSGVASTVIVVPLEKVKR